MSDIKKENEVLTEETLTDVTGGYRKEIARPVIAKTVGSALKCPIEASERGFVYCEGLNALPYSECGSCPGHNGSYDPKSDF